MKIIMKFKVNIDKIISVDESGMPCAPNPRQLLDKDVLALYSRDKTQDKKRYIAECGVIYYLGDPKSPCRQKGCSDNECLKEAIENFNLEENYTPDGLVLKLIDKYYKQNITEAGVALEALQKSVHISSLAANRINEELNKKLNGAVTTEDIATILNLIDAVNKRIVEIPNLTKAIKEAYENLRNEEEEQIARGGKSITSSMDADEEI